MSAHASEVRYARLEEAHIAYRVIDGAGAGEQDVILVSSGTASMDAMFEDRIGARLLEGLAAHGRLVVFDRRGIGLSDPPMEWSTFVTTRWVHDLEAVVAASGVRRPVLVSDMGGGSAALRYCAGHADEVRALVMVEPQPVRLDRDLLHRMLAGEIDTAAHWSPSRADEPGFREWHARAGRTGASPWVAAHVFAGGCEEEVREITDAARRVGTPTLILRRPGHRLSPPRERDPYLALVPGSERVDIPGEDRAIYGNEVEALLGEVSRFLTGEYSLPSPERVLAAVLFSDLVASTERTTRLGDARWRHLMDRHDALAHAIVGRRAGTVIKGTGDGMLAVFGAATSAIEAGVDLRDALRDEGLELRAGVHVGDIDRRGDDVCGIAVVVAARVCALAEPGELLVSEPVPRVVSGSGIAFRERGAHRLKGIPGSWGLSAVDR